MFTGIIVASGRVCKNDANSHELAISAPVFLASPPKLGQSIAIDGVCLSVKMIDTRNALVSFDLGRETRELTLLTDYKIGQEVNIEFPMALGDRLDGHIVQGHVDALGKLSEIRANDHEYTMVFSIPSKLLPYVVQKGSIAINGVSLTINAVLDHQFEVCLIPLTLEKSNLGKLKVGDAAHIETDIIGRYVEKFSQAFFSSRSKHKVDL